MTTDQQKELPYRIREEAVVALTQSLVSVPSHNDHPAKESQVAAIVGETLRSFGCEVAYQEVEPNRTNVVGVLRGSSSGRNILLNGHLDTVPPGQMLAPFSGSVRDGRILGRGTADMKGAIASMLVAMRTVAESSVQLAGDVIFAGTVAEESGAAGMNYLMESGAIVAAACIVGEPTSLDIGVAHKGIEWLEVSTAGVASHASIPGAGINAIAHMTEIVSALHRDLLPRLNERIHKLLGPSTMNIGTIQGGVRPNIVPERCSITVDRRWLPCESVESIREELDGIVSGVRRRIPELVVSIRRLPEISAVWHGPYETDMDSEILCVARGALSEWGRAPQLIGLPFWSDGALAQRRGIPTIIVGPGDATACHTADESVAVDRLLWASRSYCRMILDFCSRRPK